MKLIRVLFKPEHIDLAQIRSHEKNGILNIPDLKARLTALERIGDAVTLIYDGRIVGFTGFLEMWPGVCEIWLVPTVHIQTAALPVARMLRGYVASLAETFKFHRMQTYAPDDELHNRWMKFLGFHSEGTLEKYSQAKQDYQMWARIFKWD